MKANDVQLAVQAYLYEKSHPYQALNLNRSGYYESDVLAITSSKLVTEVEVKVSLSDFKADFKKTAKHYRLSKGIDDNYGAHIPNRFYFACPSELIHIDMIPPYAGLIYVKEDGSVEVIKKAPLLHKNKASDKLYTGMLENLTAKTIFGCQYMTYKNRKK